ncbi:MAG: SEC-C domain-containing protein [Planctomycetaceae bacterium]|jgi:tetratricopeptide (TPR) repeat protein|nr:SEC-C domain-containing protein [Planctomycetaceae bacterium]
MNDFPNIPGFSVGSPRELKSEIEKINQAIQRGAVERRRQLFEKLGQLALAYVFDCQFDLSLKTIEELNQLMEMLVEEGQFELRKEYFIDISQVITAIGPVSRQNDIALDLSPFFKHYSKSVESLPEEDFEEVKNDWALTVHQYAVSLHETNNATVAAIALLDRTIQTIEQRFNPNSLRFSDWRPLLDMYSSRGIWKFDIGDRESGLADLLHYEKLAEEAFNKKETRRQQISSRTVQEGNKIIIRMGDDDLIDHLAAYNFDDQHYETILHLADMFAGRAEKEKALEYYDKALAVAQKTDRTDSHFMLFSANAEIPFRKGHMVLQFRDYEDALKLFDLAAQEYNALLKTDQKQHFETLETRLSEVERCRSEALGSLGRFDEATQAIDEMQRLLNKAAETAKISKIAREEKADHVPFAEEFKKLKKKDRNTDRSADKSSNQNFRQNKKQFTEEEIEQLTMERLGKTHNDAAADCRRAEIEYRRGHWKTALKFFLKARSILDSSVFAGFPEVHQNLCAVYSGLAKSYFALGRYPEAERWFSRAIAQVQKLINEGKLDLQPAFFETMEGQATLFSVQKKYEEAIAVFEKVYHERNRVVAENIEGLDTEYWRVHDHQRLAPSAFLLQLQSKTIRNIEENLCTLNRIDEAILWGQRELETFEQLIRLIPEPVDSYYDYSLAIISYVALLLLGGRYKEADEFLEKANQKLAEFRQENSDSDSDSDYDFDSDSDSDSDSEDTEEGRKKRIDQLVLIRLFSIFGTAKYRFEKESLAQVYSLMRQNKGSEALAILESMKEPVRQRQIEAQNEHRLLQQFWKEMEETVDKWSDRSRKDKSEWIHTVHTTSPFDPPYVEEPQISEAEEDSEELNQELAQYEKEYGGDKVTNEFLYQMLDELTGSTLASSMMRKYDEGKFEVPQDGKSFHSEKTVGRNDPCPCGSGKKYKKCCKKQK